MRGWRFLPQVMVRVAGFPVDLLETLLAVETVELFARLDIVEDELAACRADAVIPALRSGVDVAWGADDRAALRTLSQARRAVVADRPVPDPVRAALAPGVRAGCEGWNALLASREALVVAARERFAVERERCREALRVVIARADVLDALLVSSPGMRVAAVRYVASGPLGPRTSAVRKLERRLASYVQRFCAKNETQSFFGPVNYGRLDGTSPDSVTIVRTGTGVRARESFPAQWMAERLAALIADDPSAAPLLSPRRGTWARREPSGELFFPAGGRRLALAGADLRLYDVADGSVTVAELAAGLGEPWTDTWARVRRLAAAGAVVAGPVIPPDRPDPLGWLIDWLSTVDPASPVPERWLPVLRSLRDRVRSFAVAAPADRVSVLAALSEEFTGVCGTDASRGGGDMYADRALLFEECHGDLAEFTVGGELHKLITERLAPVLRLAAHHGVLERRRDGRAAASVLSAIGRDDVALPEYLATLAARRDPAPESAGDELDRLLWTLHRLVAERGDGRVARLRGDELPGTDDAEPEEMTFTSMDLMVRAASVEELLAGRFQLIIGEVHPQPLLWVFPSAYFLDGSARASLGDAVRGGLAAQPGGAVAAQFVHTRSNKIFPYELPGHRVELRPRRSTVDSVPAAEVRVRPRDGGICCWAPETGWLRFYPPLRRRHDRLDPVAPLAFPAVHLPTVGFGDRIPRIEVDGVVLQRERWHLTGGEFGLPTGDDFGMFLAAWRRRRALGLPRQVYVRVPQEPKPVYVDFANFFLVELLAHLGRLSPTMTVTEALPATDEAWLAGPGGRFTCELRLVVLGEHR